MDPDLYYISICYTAIKFSLRSTMTEIPIDLKDDQFFETACSSEYLCRSQTSLPQIKNNRLKIYVNIVLWFIKQYNS